MLLLVARDQEEYNCEKKNNSRLSLKMKSANLIVSSRYQSFASNKDRSSCSLLSGSSITILNARWSLLEF